MTSEVTLSWPITLELDGLPRPSTINLQIKVPAIGKCEGGGEENTGRVQ